MTRPTDDEIRAAADTLDRLWPPTLRDDGTPVSRRCISSNDVRAHLTTTQENPT